MLVLSRRRDEIIEIGAGITVEVLDIKGDTVRLGITAPADIVILRREVAESIRYMEATGHRLEPAEIRAMFRARARGVDRGEYPPGESKPYRPKPNGGGR